jgi:hypothetical protein
MSVIYCKKGIGIVISFVEIKHNSMGIFHGLKMVIRIESYSREVFQRIMNYSLILHPCISETTYRKRLFPPDWVTLSVAVNEDDYGEYERWRVY